MRPGANFDSTSKLYYAVTNTQFFSEYTGPISLNANQLNWSQPQSIYGGATGIQFVGTIYYKVCNTSGCSNIVSVPIYGPPTAYVSYSPVTGCVNSTAQPSLQITWAPVANATSYEVYKDNVLQATLYSVAPWSDTSLSQSSSGKSYYYQMLAKNGAGSGPKLPVYGTTIPFCP